MPNAVGGRPFVVCYLRESRSLYLALRHFRLRFKHQVILVFLATRYLGRVLHFELSYSPNEKCRATAK